MNKNPLEIAKNIRENGAELLKKKGLETFLAQHGTVYMTGSYELDLMTWNDIDMQLVTDEDPMRVFSQLVEHVSLDPDLIEVRIIRMVGNYKPRMPRGIYAGILLNCPELGGEWKIDIWVLEQKDFEANRLLVDLLKTKLTSDNRELILEMKHELMGQDVRVPKMASHLVYQAILLEGIDDKEALRKKFGL